MTVAGSKTSRTQFVAAVPIFSGFSKELHAEIAARSTWLQLQAGDWLFRQGEAGDGLYVLRSGRLEIVFEEPEETVGRVLGRGAVVGELALLTGSVRSASVRARRDSELLKLDREHFADLLREQPDFSLALARELGRELQETRALLPPEQPLPVTISLLALQPRQPLDEVCEGLLAALRSWGRVALLDGRGQGADSGGHASALDRAESEHRQVILVAKAVKRRDDPWAQFCIRQADRVLVVAGEGEIPAVCDSFRQLRGCDLLFCQRRSQPVDIAPWVDLLQPRATHIVQVGPALTEGLECVARRLAGRSVGVVLSGGGARGLAHIGVLDELVGSGLTIDRVGGCSMGAFVGAMFAMECEPDEMRARCREEFVLRNPLSDYTLPAVSLMRGRKASAMLTRTFGSRSIEQLGRDYFCVSCDLVSGDLIVHRHGPLFEAVGASMCVPGVFAPMARDGHLLVDGGVLNNLPVEPMAGMAEGPVIAVDVTAGFLPEGASRRSRSRVRRWRARSRRAVVGVETPLPSLKETLARTIGIGSVDAVEVARRRADLLITPETGAVGLLEFQRLDEMVETGRRAARLALESAPRFPLA
jgi:predicted acylesterase/phospholipase RssA/CRP-like cAMP-binding protein